MNDYQQVFDCIGKVLAYYAEHTSILKTISIDYLFKKNVIDIQSIDVLLSEQNPYNPNATQFIQQVMVIARSLIESSVLLMYLLKKEDERLQYQKDSQMMLFKNAFIQYKYAKSGKFDSLLKSGEITLEQLKQGLIETYNNMEESNKGKLLSVIKQETFVITDSSYKLLNRFLAGFKPVFANIRKMYDELALLITFDDKNLYDLTYIDYNICSQFTHNIYPLRKPSAHDAVRICFSLTNLMGAVIQEVFKISIPDELKSCIWQAHIILHPEDKNDVLLTKNTINS